MKISRGKSGSAALPLSALTLILTLLLTGCTGVSGVLDDTSGSGDASIDIPETAAPETGYTYPDIDLSKVVIKVKTNGIVFRNADETFCYNAWPTAAVLDDGRIAITFSGLRAGHICPFGKTVMSTARQDDLNFTSSVINDTVLDDRDSGILNMGGGRLLVTFFCHSAKSYETTYYKSITNGVKRPSALQPVKDAIAAYSGLSEEQRAGGSHYIISEDGGKSWSAPYNIPVSSPHGPCLLADGTLIWVGKGMYSDDSPNIAVYKSTDGGKSFYHIDVIDTGSVPLDNLHEPHAVELPDGTLLAAIRGQNLSAVDKTVYTSDFSVFLTRSRDGGRTWSALEYTGWNGSPPHLLVTSTGAVVCTYGCRTKPYSIKARVSYDGGASWSDEYNVSDGVTASALSGVGDIGYPASVEMADGSIFTVYYMPVGSDNVPSIVYNVWEIEC